MDLYNFQITFMNCTLKSGQLTKNTRKNLTAK